MRAFAFAVTAAVACGCTVGPDYERPAVESPAAWRIEYPAALELANTRWWEQFGDPVLDELIATALRDNLDVQAAAARVDQFLGALRSTRAELFPQIGYGADASRNRASEVGQPPVPAGSDPESSLYQGALGATWQLDLFGRIRRLSEAAQAQVFASEQGRRGVVLSLVSSVAASYIALRALDQQLEIAKATAANYLATLEIFQLRESGGVASQVELSQIRSQYQQALAAIPSIELQVAQRENLLSLLVGRASGDIPRGKAIADLVPPPIPADLPASLLERRPDVLQAEQALVAANANIGAAKALYYPTVSLTGTLGSVSTAFGDFLTGASKAWSVGASLTGPIFTFGAIEGQVMTAEAAQREALAFYRQVILNAFRETNDALIGTQKKREEATAQAARVTALTEYARLSRLKYDNGYASYLEVLYAENELFSAQLAAVRAQAESYAEVVSVYKSMGGGWVDEADALTSAGSPDEPKPEGG